MQHTEHYNLNQYQPEDSFQRTDFNADNAILDAALHTQQTGLDGIAVQMNGIAGQVTGLAQTVQNNFNTLDAKIDAHGVKTGIYIGTSTADQGVTGSQDVYLGFRPKAVLVWAYTAHQNATTYFPVCALALDGHDYGIMLMITDTGFHVMSSTGAGTGGHTYPTLNTGGVPFMYLAFY